ncbi:MAG: HD domain-containing protein, partial [Bacteroidales bacterium]
MSIACTIESAERKYKRILEDFFTEAWGKTCLYSHGISHHQRVWQFAKELITGDREEEPWDENFSGRLMIACYLHDSGMSVNPGNGHGIYSSKICREFLRRNGLPEVEYADVLSAIENHDKKEYCDWGSKRELQTILSVA